MRVSPRSRHPAGTPRCIGCGTRAARSLSAGRARRPRLSTSSLRGRGPPAAAACQYSRRRARPLRSPRLRAGAKSRPPQHPRPGASAGPRRSPRRRASPRSVRRRVRREAPRRPRHRSQRPISARIYRPPRKRRRSGRSRTLSSFYAEPASRSTRVSCRARPRRSRARRSKDRAATTRRAAALRADLATRRRAELRARRRAARGSSPRRLALAP